jgi:hypothetical protein
VLKEVRRQVSWRAGAVADETEYVVVPHLTQDQQMALLEAEAADALAEERRRLRESGALDGAPLVDYPDDDEEEEEPEDWGNAASTAMQLAGAA